MRGFEVLEALKNYKKVTCTSWGNDRKYLFYNNEKVWDDNGDITHLDFSLFFSRDWEIYKEYVSFTEAMKAFEEGGTVRAWEGDSPAGGYIELDEFQSFRKLAKDYPAYGLSELSRMKWTIES